MDDRKIWRMTGEDARDDDALRDAAYEPALVTGLPHRSLRLSSVLVVDRDLAFLDHVAAIGRSRLIDVRAARDVGEALHEARTHMLDAALIDVSFGVSLGVSPGIGLGVSPGVGSGPGARPGLGLGTDAGTGQGGAEHAFDLARQLRALDGYADLPLAFLASESCVAHHIAAVHAGGSLFLTKPLDARAFAGAVHSLEAERHTRRPRVLVLDDEPEVARALAGTLAAQRMDAYFLSSPLEILDALEQVQPSLLLLDVDMPELSGLEVCKMLRASARWKDLPVLLATADASEEVRIACFEAGADDYVHKPVSERELLARIHARLERLRLQRERADRDTLTGLLLRHAFAEALAARLNDAQRDHRPVSIALLDLDGFKRLNDDHGHLAGDRVLAAFGKLLATAFRANDLRGRWGGEEFVVAFCGEDAASATAILERTRRELEARSFQGDHGAPFRVTFSAGVAAYPHDGLALDQLLQAADRRLHAAKAAGRARIESGRRRPDTGRWPPIRE
jgi:diguanylate cyclase (GGDEF)-like protein